MRVVQLIDSLTAGGAERMAVNYANELSNTLQFSGLIATRFSGDLIYQVNKNVDFLCLNKKFTIDLKAILLFRNYIIKNEVTIVHAHGTSFFFAFLVKIFIPKIKLIWHEHYGESIFMKKKSVFFLKIILRFFSGIIVVNQQLKNWVINSLNFKNVIYLHNFPVQETNVIQKTTLNGIDGKRIICLANIKKEKNHYLLLKVAEKIKKSHPDWTFHLVGKDFKDDYSKSINELIAKNNLTQNIFFYDSRQDISNVLEQSEIAILTSRTEGLPLALLEYGLYRKAAVVTNVGEMPNIIKNNENGFIVESNNVTDFYESVIKLIENKDLRIKFSNSFYDLIHTNFSKESVIQNYLNWLYNL